MNALKLGISAIPCQVRARLSDYLIRNALVNSGLLLPIFVQGKLISMP